MNTLVDLLRWRAAQQSKRQSYVFLQDGEAESGSLTFAELEIQSRALAVALRQRFARGDRVLLLYPPGLPFVVAFLGCLYAGLVAVPAYPPRANRGRDRLRAIARDAEPALVLGTSSWMVKARRFQREWTELADLPWLASDELMATGLAAGGDIEAPRPDDLALLQYTSGSTSTPKGVQIHHAQLMHNEAMITHAFEQTDESVIVSWLPLYHDMGLIGGVLQPLYVGARCILMSPFAFLQRPIRWLRAIDRYRATTSGGPDFAYALCAQRIQHEERQDLDLRSWRVAFNGSEPVRASTLDAFHRAFAEAGFDRRAFFPCYGLAEATLFVTGSSVNASPRSLSLDEEALSRHEVRLDAEGPALVSSGWPRDGQEIVLADPENGQRLGTNQVGEIWIRGRSLAAGYWRRPDDVSFSAHLRGEPEAGSFLRTGDLGFFAEGELFITGRLKDLIILRGRNHYPQDIEYSATRAHPALRADSAAAFSVDTPTGEALVVAVELARRFDGDMDDVARTIREAIGDAHELEVEAVLLLRAGTLPKTSSGKVQRRLCRQLYLQEELHLLSASQLEGSREEGVPPSLDVESLRRLDPETRRTSVSGWLRATTSLLVRQRDLPSDKPLVSLGLDSVGATRLSLALMETFGVEIGPEWLLDEVTLEDVLNRLDDRDGEKDLAAPATDREAAADIDNAQLSIGQEALWFTQQLDRESSAYHLVAAARTSTALDLEALRAAFGQLLVRHELLGASFFEADGVPRRAASSSSESAFLTDTAGWDHDDELLERLEREAYRPFNLEDGPLCRLRIFQNRGEDGAVMLFAAHHLVADYLSLVVLARELDQLYRGASLPAGVSQSSPYGRFVRWQQAWLRSADGLRSRDYWLNALRGCGDSVLDLPSDRPRPSRQTFGGSSVFCRLNPVSADRLRQAARDHAVTPFVLWWAAFAIVLGRLADREDVLIGTPAVDRPRPEFQNLVGYCVNPVVLRSPVEGGDPSLATLLASCGQTVRRALSHRGYPLPRLIEALCPDRDSRYAPLFQVMLTFHEASVESEASGETADLGPFALGLAGGRMRVGEAIFEGIALPERRALFDLTLTVATVDGGFGATLQYNTDLFDRTTARRWNAAVVRVVRQLLEDPERTVDSIDGLSRSERHQLLRSWQGRPASDAPNLIERLSDAVRTCPDRIAVVGDGEGNASEEAVTYAEFDHRTTALAATLQRKGLVTESRIGIYMSRRTPMVLAMAAVLRAGGAYVPLDPAYPQDRVAFMLEDAEVLGVLTEHKLRAALPEASGWSVVLEGPSVSEGGDEDSRLVFLSQPLKPAQLAYVLYTSGSTGQPKGVAIAHRGVAALLEWARVAFSGAEVESVLASTSICFDLSIFELWMPLTRGGTVVLAESALALPSLSRASRLSLVNTVPSALAALLDLGWPRGVGALNLAGEPLPRALVSRAYSAGAAGRVLNLYGPSEDTTYSTWASLAAEDTLAPSIGRPLDGTQVHVVDARAHLVRIGEAGELWLSGPGLARGYLARPARTAASFVPNPWAEQGGERSYRTGDRVRFRTDGELEFLGRTDHQVKVRGFRIELGEIEAVLIAHPSVRSAAVLAVGGERLMAWVELEPSMAATGVPRGTTDLERHLASRLPTFMRPEHLEILDALPLTPNGKIDRRTLADRALIVAAPVSEAPGRTPVEELLATLWAAVLGLDSVGRDGHFFALGGHSLLAVRLIARIRHTLNVEVPIQQLFESPTPARLAAALECEGAAVRSEAAGPRALNNRDALPLSHGQEHLWFLAQLEPESPAYHLPARVRWRGRLDILALERAWQAVVQRHEVLRCRFVPPDDVSNRPSMQVQSTVPRLAVIDWQGLNREDGHREMERQSHRLANRPFRDGLWRSALGRLSAKDHVWVLVLHHAICDGGSIPRLRQALAAAYAGEAEPEPLSMQFADFAAWQRERIEHESDSYLEFWRTYLARATPLALPSDHRDSASVRRRVRRQPLALSTEVFDGLRSLGGTVGVTPFLAFLGTFFVWLFRWSGQRDLVLGTPWDGRGTSDALDRLAGHFAQVQPVRLRMAPGVSFAQVLDSLRQDWLRSAPWRDLPFEAWLDGLGLERRAGRHPVFETIFALRQDPPAPVFERAGVRVEDVWEEIPVSAAKFDAVFTLDYGPTSISGTLEGNASAFDATTLARWSQSFGQLAAAAIAEPSRPIAMLPIGSSSQRHQLTIEWNATNAPIAEFIPQRVWCAAREFPESVIRGESGAWTFRTWVFTAAAMAQRLQQLGAGPEHRVVVLARRSPETLLSWLATLFAGAAYVPIDPAYPDERILWLLEDATPTVRIIERAEQRRFPSDGVPCLVLEEFLVERVTEAPADWQPAELWPESLAYAIYTSGSTGRPKGVMISHRSLANLVTWHQAAYEIRASDRATQTAALGFDAAVWEVWPYLTAGASLELVPEALRTATEPLAAWLQQRRITLSFLPTPVAQAVLDADWDAETVPRAILTGGDALQRRPGRAVPRWVNHYGPTENTVVATAGTVHPGEDPSLPDIGRPIANVQAFLFDRQLRSVPLGVPGELCLAGVGLARGYLARPAQTAERFVPEPAGFDFGGRLYRTGDLTRWRQDGTLEFLGRIDQQLKVHGIRIEPGEIETALVAHPRVTASAVLGVGDGSDRRLVAYVATSEPGLDWRAFLRTRLPAAMIPAIFVELDALPLTPNGKLDRRALPAPPGSQERDYIAPRTALETQLLEIWREVLTVEQLGVDDNFFELGGSSIRATEMASRIRRDLGIELAVRHLFETQTIAELAVEIERQQRVQSEEKPRRVAPPITRLKRPS